MKVLFVSLSTPPAMGSHTTRVLAFVRGLVSRGHEVHCLTGQYSDFDLKRSGLAEEFNSLCKSVVRVSRGAVSGRAAAAYKTNQAASGLKTYARNMARKFAVPDTFVEWIPPAYRAARRMNAEVNGFDLVVSSGAPFSAHIVGALSSRKFSVPLVLDYGDPWVFEPGRPRGFFRFHFERFLERRVLRAASHITVTTPETLSLYNSKFEGYMPDGTVVYMGYSQADFDAVGPSARDTGGRLDVVYAGRVNTEYRDLDVLKGFLYDAEESSGLNVKFAFFSQERSEIIKALGNSAKLSQVEISDAVPHHEFVALLRSSGANLLLGNRSAIQIPGKVFQYIGAQKPIIYIPALQENECDPTLDILLSSCAGLVRVARDSHGLVSAINDVVAGLVTLSQEERTRCLRFEWRNQAALFSDVCEGVVTSKNRKALHAHTAT